MTPQSLGPLFDVAQSLEAKEAALEQVLSNAGESWTDAACQLVPFLHGGEIVMAEDWRQSLTQWGVTPHHHNGWGALTSKLLKQGVVSRLNEYGPSKDPRSHGRLQPRYLVKGETV